MMATDAVAHGLNAEGQAVHGPKEFETFQRAFLNAFPDLKVTVDDVIAEADKVALRWRVTGTLQGEGLGIQPTGRSMTITGMSIVRIRNNQIVEGWNNFDMLGMHQQLGTLSQL